MDVMVVNFLLVNRFVYRSAFLSVSTFVYRSVASFVKTLDKSRPITAAIATHLDTDQLVSGNTMVKNSSCNLFFYA